MIKVNILMLSAILMLAASISNQSFAQSVTGELKGSIATGDGSPVEGANIIISGASMQGERGCSSESNGSFAFLNLPAGDYKLTVSHVSYRPLAVTAVQVNLGSMTNLGALKMTQGKVTLAPITISADRIQNSEFNDRLAKTQLDNLPVNRDYKTAITLLPQVNTSYFGDGLSINGATGAENMFYINGINVTDNFSSQFAPNLNNASYVPYNFIREISVKESGYSAEYGRALGGIVDVVTQSGSNEFRGQGFAYYSGSFLNANPKGGNTGSKIGKTSNYDAGFSFGGPIIKDKLWYFAAYSYYQNERETEIAGFGYYPDKTESHLAAMKVDWKVSNGTSIGVTIIADPTKVTPIVPLSAIGAFVPSIVENPDAVLAETANGGLSAAISGSTQITQRTLVEYSLSAYKKSVDFRGATEYGRNEPQFYDATSGTISGGLGYEEDYDISKKNARIKVSHHDDHHTVKGGFEIEFNSQEGIASYPANGNISRWDVDYYTVDYYHARLDLRSLYQAAFYQHEWQMSDKVTFEAGIRWEMQQLRDGTGNVFQTFRNQWQPRLNVIWYPDGDEKKRLSVRYGRVYQTIPLLFNILYGSGTDDYDLRGTFYSTDPRSPGAMPDGTLYDISGQTNPIPYDKYIFNSNYSDQFSIQYTQQLNHNLKFNVRLIWKYLQDAFLVGSDTSYNRQIGNPGKGDLSFLPEVKQSYTAMELGLTGESMMGHLTFGLFYVWSRNYGNYTGFWDQESRYYSLTANTLGFQTTEERTANGRGLLPSDRTHSLKLTAAYKFNSGISAGTYFLISSGTPLNEYVPNQWAPGYSDLLIKRGTAGRLPVLWDVNFRLAYQKPGWPLRISLDIFHVGNPQQVVDQVQVKFSDPGGSTENPSYRKPVRRQDPMALRFGIEYNF